MSRAARLGLVAGAAALAGLALAMVLGGAAFPRIIPGLPTADAFVRWALPVSRLVMDVAGALTVGLLMAAAAFFPSDKGMLGATAQGYVKAASWSAVVWAAGAAATLLFGAADTFPDPLPVVVQDYLTSYASQTPQGIGLTLVVLFALAIALFSRGAITVGAAGGLLVLAIATMLPPSLTGHAASSPNHDMAISGLAAHVVGIALWVGGLAVLSFHALRKGPQLEIAADRFSRMALWAYILVGLSGLFSVLARLAAVDDLWTSSYGMLIVAKIAAFVLLGYAGWWHRRSTLAQLGKGSQQAFVRLAVGEVVLMAATMGLAVVLSRTPPPVVDLPADRAFELLGFLMPPEISAANLASLWRFDLFTASIAALLGGLYAAGVVRLVRRGDAWPWGRTISWFVGVAILVVATQSGLARYAMVMFSAHMVEHMTLTMVVPIFLVLGAPMTLALRALKPAAKRGDRGPREWLTVILNSGFVKVISHPAIATAIFVASTYALYFTPLFQSAMEEHLGHIVMTVHFLASGCLFFWVIIGVDPAPHRLPYVGRLLTLFVTMPFHAFFGIALMMFGSVIAQDWYEQLGRTWGGTLLEDQNNGGAIAWGFGEIPTLIVLIALAYQWYHDEERKARRSDRRAEKGDVELAAYNAYLARLNKADKGE
ncbi:cytochrome c oxidase assembly protein [Nonomuraea soli]|uniref:Putative copper resistance protein D n=1 Tax=Nonomuraea soli TaxID=1032476 RepID=A0A7W0HN28_9ACTN|nr:cytochrome c oxidase assembly protein [Nonomuraea soli]MBA2889343.1 putative copper resistance protein D [Nonomuraea soli]